MDLREKRGSFLFLIKVLTYSSTRSEKNIIRNLFIVVQFDFKSLLALNREMEIYTTFALLSLCYEIMVGRFKRTAC